MKGILVFLITFNLLLLQSCNIVEQQSVEEDTSTIDEFVTIKDIKNKDVFFFSKSEVEIPEANTNKSIRLKRTSENLQSATVYFVVLSEATYGEDWQNLKVDGVAIEPTQTAPIRAYGIPFSEGATSVTISFEVLNDNSFEGIESMMFMLKPDLEESYEFKFPSVVNFKFIDSTNYPTVSLTVPASITEGQTDTITLTLDSASTKPVRVPINLSGSASASDHNLTPQVVTIEPGDKTLDISIEAIDDAPSEVTETLTISLGQPTNANLSDTTTGTIEITENNAAPVVNISVSNDSFIEDVSITLTATITGTLDRSISLPVSFSGSAIKNTDYTVSSSSFSFSANVDNPISTITVTAIDDAIYEGIVNETINFSIPQNPFITLGASLATTSIIENEAQPTVSFTTDAFVGQEGSTYRIPFTISPVSSLPITVRLSEVAPDSTATSDDHSLDLPQDIIIPAGVSSFQKSFFIKNDNVHDHNETLKLQISSATFPDVSSANFDPAGTHTITILDAGTIPKLSFTTSSSQVNEDAGTVTITARLDKPSSTDLSFTTFVEHISTNTTVPDITEANEIQTITFSAGQTSKTFTISITDDTYYEPIQQFMVGISEHNGMALGNITTHTVSIIDNEDIPSVSSFVNNFDYGVYQISSDQNEDSTKDFLMEVRLSHPSDYTINVAFSIDSGNLQATENVDYIINTENKLFTFNPGLIDSAISIDIIEDDIYEPTEFITVRLEEGTNYTKEGISPLLFSIFESSEKPIIRVKTNVVEVTEGSTATISFELDRPTYSDIDVEFHVPFAGCMFGGRAGSPNDINILSHFDNITNTGSFSISKGSTSASIIVEAINDNMFESNFTECIAFQISVPEAFSSHAQVDAETPINQIGFIRLTDVNPKPTISFNTSNKEMTVDEGTSLRTIPIFLSNPAEDTIKFYVSLRADPQSPNPPDNNDLSMVRNGNYRLAGYTKGESGDDYFHRYELTFQPGETVSNISIDLDNNCAPSSVLKDCDDDLYEGPEIAEIVLSDSFFSDSSVVYEANNLISPIDGKANNVFTINITDDEPFPEISIIIDNDLQTEGTTASYNNIKNILVTEGTQTGAVSITHPPVYVPETINWSAPSGDAKFYEAIVKIEPAMQHLSTLVDLEISGDAERSNQNLTTSSKNYHLNDYHIYDRRTNSYVSSDNFQITLPATNLGYNEFDGEYSLIVAISNDLRIEQNEVLNIDLVSVENDIPIVQENDQIIFSIIDNNDNCADIVATENVTMKEYDKGVSLGIALQKTLFDNDILTGSEISEKSSIYIPINKVGIHRYDNNETIKETGLNFTLSSDFEGSIAVDGGFASFSFDEMRKFESISIKSQCEGESATNNLIDVYYDEIIVKASKGQYILPHENGDHFVYGHSCSVYRGLVSCWGANHHGQLGRGNTYIFGNQDSEQINDVNSTINLGSNLYAKDIALGQRSTCVLFTNNRVKCFGHNINGQLGIGKDDNNVDIGNNSSEMGDNLSFALLPEGSEIKSIHAGNNTYCIFDTNNEIRCWGSNYAGIAGVESEEASIGDDILELGQNLQKVKLPGTPKKFAMGGNHACIISTGDDVYCWGSNLFGQLGLNTDDNERGIDTDSMSNIQVDIGNNTPVEIALGDVHTCITLDSNTYNTRCWGSNLYGQLGTGRVTAAGSFFNDQQNFNERMSFINYNNGNYRLAKYNYLIKIGGQGNSYWDDPLKPLGQYPAAGETIPAMVNLPYNYDHLESVFEEHYLLQDLGVNKNQYVQVFLPASKIIAGSTFSCGIYYDELSLSNDIGPSCESTGGSGRCNENFTESRKIRCWGSNAIFYSTHHFADYQGSTIFSETGVLNNNGYHYTFTGSIANPFSSPPYIYNEIPFNANLGEAIAPFDAQCAFDGGIVRTDYLNKAENSCKWGHRLTVVGDESWDAAGNGFVNNGVPDNKYEFGFLKDILGIGHVNFELNSKYSMVRNNFTSLDSSGLSQYPQDFQISAGGSHVCVAPKYNTHYRENNVISCWGANYSSQTGIPPLDSTKSWYRYTVGGRLTDHADIYNGKMIEFNYTF